MIGRIVKAVDFERVLRTPARARSGHFVFHHLPGAPLRRAQATETPAAAELSTPAEPAGPQAVDEWPSSRAGVWLGAVVPKRHAKRAVSRSLIKRQIRAAFARQGHLLDPGLWVVRLRQPFERAAFPSAASVALRTAVHADIALAMTAALAPARLARPGKR